MEALKALLAPPFAPALVITALMALMAAPSALAEDRAYELVSPGDDPNSKSVDVLPVARSSSSGEAIAFQMLGTFDGGSSNIRNTYLAKRTANGWTTELLTPPAAPWSPSYSGDRPYTFSPNQVFQFSDDLSKTLLSSKNDVPLVPGEPTEVTNLYLRDNDRGTYQLLTNVKPARSAGSRDWMPTASPRVAWASKDLQHVVFDSYNGVSTQYFPDWPWSAVGAWSPQTGLQLVSIMPDGQKASADAGAGPLHIVAGPGTEYFSDYYGGNEHAISEDGSRIFFTNPSAGLPNTSRPVGRLYVRRDNGTPSATTVQVDEPEPGAADQGARGWASRFITATPDGRRALFSTCGRLTVDSTAVNAGGMYSVCQETTSKDELYIYDEATGLTDIATGDPAGGDVLGVAGVSEDLSRVYFVAKGSLTGGAVAGEPNLYLWDEATGLTFVAELGALNISWHDDPDAYIWDQPLGLNDARVSADGSTIAMSTGAKIDPTYDNFDPDTWDGLKQIYVYEIGDAKPRCVTCIGVAVGESTLRSQRLSMEEAKLAVLPDWQKRNLLPDGSRLYFESAQQLLTADRNRTTDVYEYNFETDSLALISSGQGASPSHFMGASVDGRDVFFRTSQGLLSSDTNGSADLYDARRGGGDLPVKEPQALPCTDNCPVTPGSINFSGPGNLPAAKPFTLAKITAKQRKRFARRGRLTIVIGAPGAGRVVVRAFSRLPGGRRRVATARVEAKGEGRQRLTLKLTKRARRVLAKKGRLAVRINVRFGGQQRTAKLILRRDR